MMINKSLLSKKKSRQKSNSKLKSNENEEEDSPMFEINGFKIVELLYTESLSNKISFENNLINLEETDVDKIEFNKKKVKIKDSITKTELEEIEEYYILQYGIKKIKENCFICLMNNFLSNELLYFSSRKNLFYYFRHCFLHYNKIIFVDEKITKKNKEQFFSVNEKFMNSWRFFIPKTICKGCFMQLINTKDLIYKIRNIFCDTDDNSICQTNYKNYAAFSKLFRKEFNIGVKQKKITKEKNLKSICIKKKPIMETIELSDSETSEINNIKNSENEEKVKYNQFVEYNKNKHIIFINKSIFNLENNKNGISKSNKIQEKIKYENNKNQKKTINNIITFQGPNFINIINNININQDNFINNNNLIDNYIELITDRIKSSLFEFDKYVFSLKNLKDSILLIYSFSEEVSKKLIILLIYKNLLKVSSIQQIFNCLFLNYKENKNQFDIQLLNLKNSFEKANDFVDNIYNKIFMTHFQDENKKNELLSKIKKIKIYLIENIKYFEIYNNPLHNFEENFYCLLILIYKLTSE